MALFHSVGLSWLTVSQLLKQQSNKLDAIHMQSHMHNENLGNQCALSWAPRLEQELAAAPSPKRRWNWWARATFAPEPLGRWLQEARLPRATPGHANG